MAVKTIYLVEGPAGSGKSTFIKTLSNMGLAHQVQLPVTLERPRAYDFDDNGVRLSSLKDLLSLWTVLMEAPQSNPSFVDRAFISQLVYGYIRSGNQNLLELSPSLLRGQIQSFSAWITLDKMYRGVSPQEDSTLYSFHYVFYLPPLEVIKARRTHSTAKTYPYLAELELQLYLELAQTLGKVMPGTILLRNLEDENRFIKRLNGDRLLSRL